MAALRPGDKVVVIGVTGGVGQLTVARLANEGKYKVRAVGRSAERSKQVLGLDNIEYASADTKEVRGHDRLGTQCAVGSYADLVRCAASSTPSTSLWMTRTLLSLPRAPLPCLPLGGRYAAPSLPILCATVFDLPLSQDAGSRNHSHLFLNLSVACSQGGNTPDAVDRRGVKNILAALSSRPRKKQVHSSDPISFTMAHLGPNHASPRMTGGRMLRASCDPPISVVLLIHLPHMKSSGFFVILLIPMHVLKNW